MGPASKANVVSVSFAGKSARASRRNGGYCEGEADAPRRGLHSRCLGPCFPSLAFPGRRLCNPWGTRY